MLVDKLNWVFDADNVATGASIPVSNHRCKRCRLTCSCCTHKNDQPALGHRQFVNHRRQQQVSGLWNVYLNTTQNHSYEVALVKRAYSKTSEPACIDCKVALFLGNEGLVLVFVHHTKNDVARLIWRQCILASGIELAVDLQRGWLARRDKQVRSTFFHNQL